MLLFALPAAASPVSFEALATDPLATLLADPNTPSDFRLVVLSHAAEVCAGRAQAGVVAHGEGKACLDRLAAAAIDPRFTPWGRPPSDVQSFGEEGLYLTHLAIVLGERDRIAPEACDHALHQRVVAHLVDRSMAHPSGVARSTSTATGRWPADQAATLFAIHLYDQAHGTSWTAAPTARYLAGLGLGLPPSELTGFEATSGLARGSALAYTVRYLAEVARPEAKALWTRVRAGGFVVAVGPVTGVREWPPGVDGPQDDDSGPIVAGLGAAATALGRLAAQEVGDRDAADALRRTANVGRTLAAKGFPGLPATAGSSLAAAITARAELHDPRGGADGDGASAEDR